jgi:hypothetical protein
MFNQPRTTQNLAEAVTSLISMILVMIRARGLRGLLDLPAYWRLYRELRLFSEQFAALYAAFKAGTLPPVPPAPEPWPAPEYSQAAPAATTAATPRLPEPRLGPARRHPPASKPGSTRRALARPKPPIVLRRPSLAHPRPPRGQPGPYPVLGLSAGILVTARCR